MYKFQVVSLLTTDGPIHMKLGVRFYFLCVQKTQQFTLYTIQSFIIVHFTPDLKLKSFPPYIFRCWPNCLEFCPRTCGIWMFLRTGQLQAVTEDVFIYAVLVYSAH